MNALNRRVASDIPKTCLDFLQIYNCLVLFFAVWLVIYTYRLLYARRIKSISACSIQSGNYENVGQIKPNMSIALKKTRLDMDSGPVT